MAHQRGRLTVNDQQEIPAASPNDGLPPQLSPMAADVPHRVHLSMAETRPRSEESGESPLGRYAGGPFLTEEVLRLTSKPAEPDGSETVQACPTNDLTPLQRRIIAVLFRLGQEPRLLLDFPAALKRAIDVLIDAYECESCAIFIQDEATGEMVLEAAAGRLAEAIGVRIARADGLVGNVALEKTVRVVQNGKDAPRARVEKPPPSGPLLLAPLTINDTVFGALLLEDPRQGTFGDEDVRLLEEVQGYLSAMAEVAHLYRQAELAAMYDGLTGVHNYRYFHERLQQELSRSQRHGMSLTIVLIDVDDLKRINDTFGHLAGDETLRAVGRVLLHNLRASDVVARYGGDEFAIIMPQTGKEEAVRVLRRVMQRLDGESITQEGKSFTFPGCSMGLSTYPQDGLSAVDLFAVADGLLYEKKRGKLDRTP